jgi:hypothetical protein
MAPAARRYFLLAREECSLQPLAGTLLSSGISPALRYRRVLARRRDWRHFTPSWWWAGRAVRVPPCPSPPHPQAYALHPRPTPRLAFRCVACRGVRGRSHHRFQPCLHSGDWASEGPVRRAAGRLALRRHGGGRQAAPRVQCTGELEGTWGVAASARRPLGSEHPAARTGGASWNKDKEGGRAPVCSCKRSAPGATPCCAPRASGSRGVRGKGAVCSPRPSKPAGRFVGSAPAAGAARLCSGSAK